MTENRQRWYCDRCSTYSTEKFAGPDECLDSLGRHMGHHYQEDFRQEAYRLVLGFFDGDVTKACLWMGAPNPLLGYVSPNYMLRTGRGEKVVRAIREALAENPPRQNPVDTDVLLTTWDVPK